MIRIDGDTVDIKNFMSEVRRVENRVEVIHVVQEALDQEVHTAHDHVALVLEALDHRENVLIQEEELREVLVQEAPVRTDHVPSVRRRNVVV